MGCERTFTRAHLLLAGNDTVPISKRRAGRVRATSYRCHISRIRVTCLGRNSRERRQRDDARTKPNPG